MMLGLLLALPAIALADVINGDADADALATPHGNNKTGTQNPGAAAVSYDFDVFVENTGPTSGTQANANDVFKDPGDYVKVDIARAGDWLNTSDSGSPSKFIFTQYTVDDTSTSTADNSQSGTIKIKVPCGATGSKAMTVTVTGTAMNAGPDGLKETADDVTLPSTRQLGTNTLTFTYTITAGSTPDASCVTPPATPTLDLKSTSDSGDSDSDDKTNDDTPTFEGTAKAGSTVNVYDGAVAATNLLGSATANATNGAWSFEVPAAKALSEGTHTISATATDAGGTSTAATLSVLIDKTAPAANCGMPPTGWSASDVSITCAPTDTGGSGLSTAAASLTPASFNLVTNVAAGTETNNASTNSRDIYDVAGNKATAGPISGIMIDKKVPSTTADAGSYNFGDWTNQNVTVTLDANDDGSGVNTTEYSLDGGAYQAYPSGGILVNTEGDHTISFKSTDNVNNAETAQSVRVKVDKTNPTIQGSRSPLANSFGWTNQSVTVSFLCGDQPLLSGLASCTADTLVSSEGANQSVEGTATDNAGNTNSDTVSGISIDKTKPTVAVTGITAATYTTTDTLPTPGCNVTDQVGLSGPVDASPAAQKTSDTRNSNGVGSVTYRCEGTDKAGNSDSATKSFSVIHGGVSGILQPINSDNTSLFSRGRSVPVKFQLAGDGANSSFPNGFNTSGWTLQRVSVNCTTFDAADAEAEAVPSNTPSTVFRYDSTADQYIYNADFRDKAAGTCWKVKATLDDSTTVLYSAVFKLQK
jgi:hypothetical protein